MKLIYYFCQNLIQLSNLYPMGYLLSYVDSNEGQNVTEESEPAVYELPSVVLLF